MMKEVKKKRTTRLYSLFWLVYAVFSCRKPLNATQLMLASFAVGYLVLKIVKRLIVIFTFRINRGGGKEEKEEAGGCPTP